VTIAAGALGPARTAGTRHRPRAVIRALPWRLALMLVPCAAAAIASGGVTAQRADASAARALLSLTDEARADAGLPPLARNDALTRVALAHAREMARTGDFAHVSAAGGTLQSRAGAAGYGGWRVLAENLATDAGAPDAAAIVAAWLRSPAHRANLLSAELRDAGAACVVADGRAWCALEFGARE